jgi:integrase
LIEEAETEIKQGILPRKWKAKKYIISFRKYLQDQDLSAKTIQGTIAAVKSFYSAFDIKISKIKNERNVTILEENIPIPTKEDIQAALKVCNPMERAVLLIGVSSGLSTADIIKLKVKQITEGQDKETGITTLHIRRTKTQYDFVTFLSQEASQAVFDYLSYRNRTAKTEWDNKHKQDEKQKVYSDNDYLFCLQNVPDVYLKTKNEKDRKLKETSLIRLYRSISRKASKNTPSGSWNLIRSHNMRKYFNSALLNAGCDGFHTEFFMGHSLDETRSAYFRTSPEKLREIYAKYMPYLTITPEKDVSESQEYLRLKEESQILAAESVRHIVERRELQDLRERLTATQDDVALKMKNISSFLDKLVS